MQFYGPDAHDVQTLKRKLRRCLRGSGPFWLSSLFIDRGPVSMVGALVELRDLWVGCYWTSCAANPTQEISVYLCAVPTLVLRVDVRRSW